MNIALIGATGYVGSALLQEFIDRGFHIKAIARNTEKIISNDNVEKITLDISDISKLAEAIKGVDVVVSAFNAGWTNPNLYDDFTKGAKAIDEAVKEAKVKRLIVIGGAGTLYINPDLQLVDTPDFPEMFKPGATAVRDYFKNVLSKETDFQWTYFSPAIEMSPASPGTRTGQYRIGTNTPVFDGENRSRISVEDVAVAIADEIQNKQFLDAQFTIGY